MEATWKSSQVGEEFIWGHGSEKRDWIPQFAYPCVFKECENKLAGFVFGGDKWEVIRNLSVWTASALSRTTFLELFGIVSS